MIARLIAARSLRLRAKCGREFWRTRAKLSMKFGGPDRDRTDDLFHAIPQIIEGTALTSRLSRQNRHNRRYSRQRCDKLLAAGQWADPCWIGPDSSKYDSDTCAITCCTISRGDNSQERTTERSVAHCGKTAQEQLTWSKRLPECRAAQRMECPLLCQGRRNHPGRLRGSRVASGW